MAWTWSVFAIPDLAVGALSLAFALAIFSARPGARENRYLAAYLLIQGLAQFFGSGLRFLTDDRDLAFGLWTVRMVGFLLALAPLFLFYGTLPGALSRPFRTRTAHILIPTLAAAAGLLLAARPELVLGTYLVHPVTGSWVGGAGAGWLVLLWASALILLLGLPISLSALRAARSSLERRKTQALALAFGVQAVVQSAVSTMVGLPPGTLPGVQSAFLAVPFASLLFLILLGAGILRAQVLDIDLRIKWTVRQGTIAGAFVAVFFTASELAQTFFQDSVGPYVGVLAAGALVFALSPLQRLSERLANAAMPAVRDTPAYLDARRREIYRAALESAARDGVITDRERDVLATLQEQLGIAATDALAMEREALSSTPVPTP